MKKIQVIISEPFLKSYNIHLWSHHIAKIDKYGDALLKIGQYSTIRLKSNEFKIL